MAKGCAEFFAEIGTVAVVECLHNLEILLILVGGAGSEFVEPFAAVELAGGAKFSECGEEVVVSGLLRGGNEVTHGEGVDGLVVKGLVCGEAGCGDFGLGAASSGRGRGEFGEDDIEAERVGGSDREEMFGIDFAGEMDVEVGAFRQADEEGAKGSGIGAGCAKGGFGFFLRG